MPTRISQTRTDFASGFLPQAESARSPAFRRVACSNPKGAVMFTHPWNNRNTRFAPGAFKRTVSWRCWRKGSQFDRGDRWRRPLDRNDRARIMHCAEALERRTKAKHKRDGVLGQSALTLLRKLVFGFLNMQSGRLD